MTTKTMTRTQGKNTVSSPAKNMVQDVIALIEDFGSLLSKETEALRKADFRMVDMLQTDKKTFAKKYHALVTTLAEHKNDVAALDLALREKLIRTRTTFTIILNDNMRALEASRESTRRMVDRILDTARKTVTEDHQTNYSQGGQAHAHKTSMRSLAVDRQL